MRRVVSLCILLGIFVSYLLVTVPTHAQTCPTLPTSTGVVTLSTTITTTKSYRIWSRIKSSTDITANSYWLQFDNTCGIKVGDSDTMALNTWTWVDYQNATSTQKVDVNLTTGDHIIRLIGNEPGVGIDKLIITDDLSCIPTGVGDNCNQVPTATVTSTPPTPTSTPVVISPTVPVTNTPAPTATPVPNSMKISVTVFLHGIGKGGDNANKNSTGNLSPLHPQRTVAVSFYDGTDTLVKTFPGSVTYNATNGNFVGTIDLGSNLAAGEYIVRIKSPSFISARVPEIVKMVAQQSTTASAIYLSNGDANNDNQINILDYNLILDCYAELSPAKNCDPTKKIATDLTDDGNVNQFDYNLLLRELSVIAGQ